VGQFKQAFSDQACTACHDTVSFAKRLPFDHSKTDFAITGKHQSAKCEDCHVPTRDMLETRPPKPKSKFIFNHADQRYCQECHANVHTKQFHSEFSGKACVTCHTTESFTKRLDFDHNLSAFKLKGKHVQVRCSKCHTETNDKFPPPSKTLMHVFQIPKAFKQDCNGCHKDPHEGNYGSKCSECHNEQGWKQSKDFHKDFALSGIHFSLECAECHRNGRQLSGMSSQCTVCHQKDDVHAGTLPHCGDCHRQQFWENPHFLHSMSNFPLRGIHRTLDCASCHDRGIYKGVPSRCIDCHRGVAPLTASPGVPDHSLLFNRSCADCHNQFSFK
jgi:hypothetical protein